MSWLPIVDRELRVASRRGKTYWLRLLAASIALIVSVWICLWTARTQPPATGGKSLFLYLSILSFAYCLLVGPFITADCVSEEKRDGTLGLLFLTELRSYNVLLGKLVAASLAGVYGLIAILPALAIPLLMGGVTPGELLRTVVAALNAMIFSLSAGMLVSTLSRDQAKGTLGAVVLVLGLTGLVPGLGTVLASGFFTRPVGAFPFWALGSPAYTGYLAQDAVFKATPSLFWLSLGAVQALSWLFLIGTAFLLPRVWRETPSEKPTRFRWLWRLGYTRRWRRLFKKRLERNPAYALAARLRWPHLAFWSLVALVAINVFWLTHGRSAGATGNRFHHHFALALVFTNRVWIAIMACRFFLEARQNGALELFLTTPLPVATLRRGLWKSLWNYFFWPVFAIGILHVLYVEENWRLSTARTATSVSMSSYYIGAACGSFLSFITDVVALSYVGAWLSLSLRRTTLAIFMAFALVSLAPWTLGYFLPSITSLTRLLPAGFTSFIASNPILKYLLPSSLLGYSFARPTAWILKNLVLVLWARHGLQRHFRAAAAQTYGLDRRQWRHRLRRSMLARWFPEKRAEAPAG